MDARTTNDPTAHGGNVFRWTFLAAALCAHACGETATNTGTRRETPATAEEAGAPNHQAQSNTSGSESLTETYSSEAHTADSSATSSDVPANPTSTAESSLDTGHEAPSDVPASAVSDSGAGAVSDSGAGAASDSTAASSAGLTSTDVYTPVENPPEGLTACEEQATSTESSCVYSLRCDGHKFWTGCFAAANGKWECSCIEDVGRVRLNYDVSGATGDDACRETFVMCLEPGGPELSERSCEYENVSLNAYACARSQSCTAQVELRPGLVVSEKARSVTSTCEYYADESSLACQCGGIYRSFRLNGVAGAAACQELDDLCAASEPTTGERHCDPYSFSMSPDWCATEQLCGERVQLEGDAYALAEPRLIGSRCQVYGSETVCRCTDSQNGYLRVSVPGEDLETDCLTTEEVCLSQDPIEVTGAVDCETTSVSGSGRSCSSQAQCSIEAAVGDHPVQLLGGVYSLCEASTGEEWTCSCTSGMESSEPFSVTGVAAFDVCSTAKDTCAEMVVGLGTPYGYEISFRFGPPPP